MVMTTDEMRSLATDFLVVSGELARQLEETAAERDTALAQVDALKHELAQRDSSDRINGAEIAGAACPCGSRLSVTADLVGEIHDAIAAWEDEHAGCEPC